MSFAKDILSDSRTGKPSSKRLVVVLAATTLIAVTVVVARVVWLGLDVDPVAGQLLGTISMTLGGMAGGSYVGGKVVDAWRDRTRLPPPDDVDESEGE